MECIDEFLLTSILFAGIIRDSLTLVFKSRWLSLGDSFEPDVRDSDKEGDADADEMDGCGDEFDDMERDKSFFDSLLRLDELGVDAAFVAGPFEMDLTGDASVAVGAVDGGGGGRSGGGGGGAFVFFFVKNFSTNSGSGSLAVLASFSSHLVSTRV